MLAALMSAAAGLMLVAAALPAAAQTLADVVRKVLGR